jgi:hypothetical protein
VTAAGLVILGAAGCESTTTGGAPPAGRTTPVPAASTATAATRSGTPAPCRADQLTVRLRPLPGAAAGTTFADVVLTDSSSAACTVAGSVGLTVLDAAHHPIPVAVSANLDPRPDRITLPPGGSAAQTVAYGSDGVPPCTAVEAAYAITPPDTTTATTVPVGARGACPDDRITLSALVTGDYSPPR